MTRLFSLLDLRVMTLVSISTVFLNKKRHPKYDKDNLLIIIIIIIEIRIINSCVLE